MQENFLMRVWERNADSQCRLGLAGNGKMKGKKNKEGWKGKEGKGLEKGESEWKGVLGEEERRSVVAQVFRMDNAVVAVEVVVGVVVGVVVEVAVAVVSVVAVEVAVAVVVGDVR